MPHQDIRRGTTPLWGVKRKPSPPFILPTPPTPEAVEEIVPVVETLESPPSEPTKRRRMKKSA